jgi:hypothetical protein
VRRPACSTSTKHSLKGAAPNLSWKFRRKLDTDNKKYSPCPKCNVITKFCIILKISYSRTDLMFVLFEIFIWLWNE